MIATWTILNFISLIIKPTHPVTSLRYMVENHQFFRAQENIEFVYYMLFLWPKLHLPNEHLQTLCSLQRRKVGKFLPYHGQESNITCNQTFSAAVQFSSSCQIRMNTPRNTPPNRLNDS